MTSASQSRCTYGAQLSLFSHVGAAYADAPGGVLDNATLYREVSERAGIAPEQLDAVVPIGVAGTPRSPLKRQIRWLQQTLRARGAIERVEGERGLWRLTDPARRDIHQAAAGIKLIAFSTDLGLAVWSRAQDVFTGIGEQVSLCVTSPPYPLRSERRYGNVDERRYVDFLCNAIEPVVRSLVRGGSLVLNLCNDIFEKGSPARSLYVERLTIALHDRLDLHLMDRVPWVNYSKVPSPTYWACRTNVSQPRVQLASAWEPVLWFCNAPDAVRSDNRRVLLEHTARHRALIEGGGENREAVYGDGAYKLRKGSFGGRSAGRIPRNVFQRGHSCADTQAYRRHAAELGLPAHGAMFPTALPEFFIRFLTTEGELVADPFAGTLKTGLAAERLGRRWLATEVILEYLRGGAEMFHRFPGFGLSPAMVSLDHELLAAHR